MNQTRRTSLALDVGNTRTKLAVFEGSELVRKEVWDSLTLEALSELAYNHRVEKIILSSVAHVAEEITAFLKSRFFFLELGTQTPLPIEIHYRTPATLGRDRIAAAAGAHALYPGEHCLVVDAGTCITLDLLTAQGHYLGGNIAPGIGMRLRAMHRFTAKLPLLVDEGFSPARSIGHLGQPIGESTESAMLNGAALGALLEVEGFAGLCGQRFEGLKLLLTGGDADFFAMNAKTKIFAHPNLVLIGLHKILQHNVQIAEGS